MPPKRPSALEEPPSASSSSEEEQEEVEEEEEGSEEEEEPVQPSLKVPNVKSNPLPKPQSSSDDDDDEDDEAEEEKADLADEDDLESCSDSDNEPVKHMIASRNAPASEVKPISSKPMADVLKSKKQDPTPTPTVSQPLKASSVSVKRPLEETNKVEKKDKRRKKKSVSDLEGEEDDGTEETEKKAAEDQKKPFQRVWNVDDEIDLLNLLRDYKKKGRNASADMNAFYEFVKDSLRIKFNKTQIQSKVQRMQKKFHNTASRGKHGEDPVISVPHDLKSYLISKEIWGDQITKDNTVEANDGGTDSSVAEGKKKRNKANSNGAASPKQKSSQLPVNSSKVEQKIEAKDNGNGDEYLYLNQSLQCQNYPELPVPPQGLTNCIAKKGWDFIGSSKAETFDQKWKAVLIAETKAYLERIDVVRDQTKSMLDALESSDV